jgi:hypothetical protein
VGAIHSAFGLSERKQTERVIRAMDHPHFHILAHPTGRLIGKREACRLDMERVMEAARERGCALELNSQPQRLDLDDRHCRMAREMGVRVAISSDAHSSGQLRNLRYGVGQARRGWLEADNVLNTLPLEQLLAILQRRWAPSKGRQGPFQLLAALVGQGLQPHTGGALQIARLVIDEQHLPGRRPYPTGDHAIQPRIALADAQPVAVEHLIEMRQKMVARIQSLQPVGLVGEQPHPVSPLPQPVHPFDHPRSQAKALEDLSVHLFRRFFQPGTASE